MGDKGTPLRPLTETEQEAFARAALRAAQLVIAPAPDDRIAADLIRFQTYCRDLHDEPLENDFSRLGFKLLPALRARGARTEKRLEQLDVLIDFRNLIGHGQETAIVRG